MKESQIENAVCKYATERGWLHYKFSSPSRRGVPDRLLLKNGKAIFIEFKVPGKTPTVLQEAVMRRITKQGFTCYVVDNVEGGKSLIHGLSLPNSQI